MTELSTRNKRMLEKIFGNYTIIVFHKYLISRIRDFNEIIVTS